jgi:hypothetical protein
VDGAPQEPLRPAEREAGRVEDSTEPNHANRLCPTQFPGTDEASGATVSAVPFPCYGACGPSCKAECVESVAELSLVNEDGSCVSCKYSVSTCKSHAVCLWHDDCYRQCDVRWVSEQSNVPPDTLSNGCYRNCDNPVAKDQPLCSLDWAQQATNQPSVKPDCWDGARVAFSKLLESARLEQNCPATTSLSDPWPSGARAYTGGPAPDALPSGLSCSRDTDCPDRNQRCDSAAGDYPGVNGWGRCVGKVPFPGIDTRAVLPSSLRR